MPHSTTINAPLGALSPQQFLDEYWQKKPLLIRQALPGFSSPVSNEELAGLACEAGVESRLIVRNPAVDDPRRQWAVRHGPFTEDDFADLPASNWTLLVQDVDKWLPHATTLLQQFRFIPDWRVDDLMISYAEDGGSVGAHWDNYDVFLIQGSGTRRWLIEEHEADPDNILDGPEIRLLDKFEPSQDWTLEPGDMLYLPPRVAHHGVAVGGGCQTLSVGFRAPSHSELLEDFCQYLLERMPADRRYSDIPLSANQHPAEITDKAIDHFKTIIEQSLKTDRGHFQGWLGEYLTRPKPGIGPIEPDQAVDIDQIAERLAQAGPWMRDGASRFAYSRLKDKQVQFFLNGQQYQLPEQQLPFIQTLCMETQLDGEYLSSQARQHPELSELLALLISEGHIYVEI